MGSFAHVKLCSAARLVSARVVCVRAEFKFRNEEHILNTNTHTQPYLCLSLALRISLSLSVFSDDVAGWMADAGARIGSNKYVRRRITYTYTYVYALRRLRCVRAVRCVCCSSLC